MLNFWSKNPAPTKIYTDIVLETKGEHVTVFRINGTLIDIPQGKMFGIGFGEGPNRVFKVLFDREEPVVKIPKKEKIKQKPFNRITEHISNALEIHKTILVEEIFN